VTTRFVRRTVSQQRFVLFFAVGLVVQTRAGSRVKRGTVPFLGEGARAHHLGDWSRLRLLRPATKMNPSTPYVPASEAPPPAPPEPHVDAPGPVVAAPPTVGAVGGAAGGVQQPEAGPGAGGRGKAPKKGWDSSRYMCQHKRRKYLCRECGGSQVCEHNNIKTTCKECKGGSLCEHGRRRTFCKDCGNQTAICVHKVHAPG